MQPELKKTQNSNKKLLNTKKPLQSSVKPKDFSVMPSEENLSFKRKVPNNKSVQNTQL